jgi:ankyrin repeat protein
LINTAIINVLADAGAEIDAKDNAGNTPLHEAVLSFKETAVAALLEKGATPTIRNHDGKTAADFAREQQCRPILRLIEKARDTRGR